VENKGAALLISPFPLPGERFFWPGERENRQGGRFFWPGERKNRLKKSFPRLIFSSARLGGRFFWPEKRKNRLFFRPL